MLLGKQKWMRETKVVFIGGGGGFYYPVILLLKLWAPIALIFKKLRGGGKAQGKKSKPTVQILYE